MCTENLYRWGCKMEKSQILLNLCKLKASITQFKQRKVNKEKNKEGLRFRDAYL